MKVAVTSLKNSIMSESKYVNANLSGGINLFGMNSFTGSPVKTILASTSATVSNCVNVIKSALPLNMLEFEPSSSSSTLYATFENVNPTGDSRASGDVFVGAGSNIIPNPIISTNMTWDTALIISAGSAGVAESSKSIVILTRSVDETSALSLRSRILNAPTADLLVDGSLSKPVATEPVNVSQGESFNPAIVSL